MADFKLKGNPFHTVGELPAVGSTAPGFSLVGADLGEVTPVRPEGQAGGAERVPEPRHRRVRRQRAPLQRGGRRPQRRGGGLRVHGPALRRQALLHHRGPRQRGHRLRLPRRRLRQGLRPAHRRRSAGGPAGAVGHRARPGRARWSTPSSCPRPPRSPTTTRPWRISADDAPLPGGPALLRPDRRRRRGAGRRRAARHGLHRRGGLGARPPLPRRRAHPLPRGLHQPAAAAGDRAAPALQVPQPRVPLPQGARDRLARVPAPRPDLRRLRQRVALQAQGQPLRRAQGEGRRLRPAARGHRQAPRHRHRAAPTSGSACTRPTTGSPWAWTWRAARCTSAATA